MKSLVLDEKTVRKIKGRKVIASFSGGADSLAMLLLLKEYEKSAIFTLSAIHFEHGFRGKESLEDAAFCVRKCREYGIPLKVISLDVPANRLKGEGDEEAARRLRFENWKKLAGSSANKVIALGHNRNDRQENLLLRLFRGGNSSSLASMRTIGGFDGMTLIRPLLNYSRSEIEEYLKSKGENAWRTDCTNLSQKYRRNFIRLRLLPEIFREFPYSDGGITACALSLTDDADYLDVQAEKVFAKLKNTVKEWRKLHSAILIRVLRLFISGELKKDFLPDRALAERFSREIMRKTDAPRRIPLKDENDFTILISRGIVSIEKKENKNSGDYALEWSPKRKKTLALPCGTLEASKEKKTSSLTSKANHYEAFFDAGNLPGKIIAACWQPGDEMVPFGRKSSVKLKKLFSDLHVSGEERKKYPVLKTEDGTILWVCGVRRSNAFAVEDGTKSVMKFTFRSECL